MSKANFTFQAALKLNSAGFKKGVADVQRSLVALKNAFLSVAGALGVGLGFGKLTSSLKDTAVQLSVAKNTLENVSKVTKSFSDGVNKGTIQISNYGENLKFVKDISKEYSQDLISLMQNFAQFHAACENTNLTLEDQKLVFESLTRAAAYYHMSADRTKDMMNAITQMMSKGKVTAEELRRQLGNSLPGAFNLMAAAMGVSTQELDDMMRKGQVIAADVLPKFAAMLNTVTKNADFDSLQMSMNRLKNSWYELVEASGAENFFKRLVNAANRGVSAVTKNMDFLKDSIKGIAVAFGSLKIFDVLQKKGTKTISNLSKEIDTLLKGSKSLQLSEKMEGYFQFKDAKETVRRIGSQMRALERQGALDYEGMRNDFLKAAAYYTARANVAAPFSKEEKYAKEMAKASAAVAENLTHMGKVTEEAAVKTNKLKAAMVSLKTVARGIGAVLKSIGPQLIIGAIIAGVTALISHLKRVREETERINKLGKEYEKTTQRVDDNALAENAKLRARLAIVKDTNLSEITRLNSLKEINKALGLVGENQLKLDDLKEMEGEYDKITAAVERWCEATLLQSRIQIQANAAAAAQARMEEIEAEKREKRATIARKKAELQKYVLPNGAITPAGAILATQINTEEKAVERLNQEWEKQFAISNKAEKKLKEYSVKLEEYLNPNFGGGGNDGPATGLAKIYEKYNADLKELKNKLRENAITQEQYNDEFDKLVTKYWDSAAASGELSLEKILGKVNKGQVLTALEKWYKDLYEAAIQASHNNAVKSIADAIEKDVEDALKESQKDLDKTIKDWIDEESKDLKDYAKEDISAIFTKKPGRGTRDTTFDYKKTPADKDNEAFDLAGDYVKELENAIQEIESKYDNLADASAAVQKKLQQWRDELALAKKEASTLEEVMKLSQIQADIDSLQESIRKTAFGSMRNFAQSIDRVVEGVNTIRETFEDADATEWEKFMSLFNEFVQVLETISTLYETFQTIQKASSQLDAAEISLINTRIALLTEELELRKAIAAQKAGSAAATQAEATADIAAAAAAKTSATAHAQNAVAGAASATAGIPVIGPVLAAGAIAAIVAAILGGMKKFAAGGYVGGNSYTGDKQLARVNSGELILNPMQQRNLLNLANGKTGQAGKVEFEIRADKLVGVIKNYNRIQRGY